MRAETLTRIKKALADQLAGLMEYRPSGAARWIAAGWIGLLFVGGGVTWYHFLNGGAIDFSRHDWTETAHRYAFLQDAASKGTLPLHMPGFWALRNVTDRFVSIADTNLSPQVYLLRFVQLGQFFLINTLFLYAAGFIGLLLLRRRFRLSPFAFTLLFLLLFFGGHIATHLSVGHAHWASYFLVPYFLYLIFDAIDGPRHPWRWILYLSVYMFVIFLQGAFHLLVASVFLCGLVALAYPERLGLLVRGVVFSLCLSSIRILPPLLHASDFDTAFLSGFTTVGELFEGLGRLVPPRPELVSGNNPASPLGWWELNYFVGAIGLAYIGFFGIYWWLKSSQATGGYRKLLLPIAVMTAFSVGMTFNLFHLLQIPLLSSQRVSSRLLYLPLSILIVLATVALQRFLDRRGVKAAGGIALALGAGLLAQDLWKHLNLWQVANMVNMFESNPLDLSLDVAANHADPPYFTVLGLGLWMSLATILVLTFLVRREGRRNPTRSGKGGEPVGTAAAQDPRLVEP